MNITMLKSKIHRAAVTEARVDYVGSITVDKKLLDAAGILEYEKVQVVDVNNGNRMETYTIAGGDGVICLNGAAAKLVGIGDKIIIMAYCDMDSNEAKSHKPTVVFVGENNEIVKTARYEKYGAVYDEEAGQVCTMQEN